MSWHIVHLADVAATPWRNGGGITRELALWPAQGEWAWRMSVAEVAASGPFSRFEGIDRWFAVLQGDGVDLQVRPVADAVANANRVQRLTERSAPFFFDGAAATDCQLLGGPTADFNLMVRKGAFASHMVRIRGSFNVSAPASRTIAIYSVDAGASVSFNSEEIYIPAATLIWRTLTKAASVRIKAAHALWMEIPA
jgi:environmental stress-induced protein Ves